MSTPGDHAPYGRRHVEPSFASLAGVYIRSNQQSRFSPACMRCRLPRAGEADIDRES